MNEICEARDLGATRRKKLNINTYLDGFDVEGLHLVVSFVIHDFDSRTVPNHLIHCAESFLPVLIIHVEARKA